MAHFSISLIFPQLSPNFPEDRAGWCMGVSRHDWLDAEEAMDLLMEINAAIYRSVLNARS